MPTTKNSKSAAEKLKVELDAGRTLDELAGRYALDTVSDLVLTLTRQDATFYAQATGQPQLEIVPTSPTTFRLLTIDASVEFHRNDDDEVDSLTLYQNGEHLATRLEEEAWEPTVEELEAFTGRYYSDEAETVVEAKDYVQRTGVDILAVSIGNAHGLDPISVTDMGQEVPAL